MRQVPGAATSDGRAGGANPLCAGGCARGFRAGASASEARPASGHGRDLVPVVVGMEVLVLELLVDMIVVMPLGRVEAHARSDGRQGEPPAGPGRAERERGGRSNERRQGEDRGCPRGARDPLGTQVEPKARAEAEGTDDQERPPAGRRGTHRPSRRPRGLMAGCRSLWEAEQLTQGLASSMRRRLGLPRRLADTTARDALCRVPPDGLRAGLHRLVRAAWRRKALQPVGLPVSVVALDGKAPPRTPKGGRNLGIALADQACRTQLCTPRLGFGGIRTGLATFAGGRRSAARIQEGEWNARKGRIDASSRRPHGSCRRSQPLEKSLRPQRVGKPFNDGGRT